MRPNKKQKEEGEQQFPLNQTIPKKEEQKDSETFNASEERTKTIREFIRIAFIQYQKKIKNHEYGQDDR
jgi:hypothetical protein